MCVYIHPQACTFGRVYVIEAEQRFVCLPNISNANLHALGSIRSHNNNLHIGKRLPFAGRRNNFQKLRVQNTEEKGLAFQTSMLSRRHVLNEALSSSIPNWKFVGIYLNPHFQKRLNQNRNTTNFSQPTVQYSFHLFALDVRTEYPPSETMQLWKCYLASIYVTSERNVYDLELDLACNKKLLMKYQFAYTGPLFLPTAF